MLYSESIMNKQKGATHFACRSFLCFRHTPSTRSIEEGREPIQYHGKVHAVIQRSDPATEAVQVSQTISARMDSYNCVFIFGEDARARIATATCALIR